MTDEVVTRLYRALVEELRRRGHQDAHPLRVSDLYQTLVPYSAVRSALGVELNADYEHALLRLLSGERDLLRLEPAHARDELRREVRAPYPYVGLFRKFSGSDVWVTMPEADLGAEPEATPEVAAAPAGSTPDPEPTLRPAELSVDRADRPAAERDTDRATVRLRPAGGAAPAAARAPVQLHRPTPQPPSERVAEEAAVCAFCTEDLPVGRRVRFCPHCGGDQRLQPCPRCEAVLEQGWRYCISCGQDISAR